MAALTATAILSAATEALTRTDAGYSLIGAELDNDLWPTDHVHVLEDPFSVVAVCVFDTWPGLERLWPDAQAAFVELLSAHLTNVDPKAWDGYLVLLTSDDRGDARDSVDAIRYDTGRVRKLVASAPELATVQDVGLAVLPLLPLVVDLELAPARPPLELLADALEDAEVDRAVVDGVLSAFGEQRPLMERLHELRQEP